ncbi:bifunctional copper resistance protein CopD/cytochrome c oxidase assembly protein [Actinoallomurus iriomotensis]|uniref:Copper resistance protein D n=1 Tax=Actinoallomurus iriomotensis TaxID=478107 RepID=A0A9W6RZH7_9ACTN|nr:bifunctional copper resistance protein CopD/cytochrome c oxidase assembly protein [Actinoallomurus iriomotensis]GLY82992.1 copper resistance protein D [Actinoallomurus iriomotensis]
MRRQGVITALVAALAGVGAMVVAGLLGGALREQVIPGLSDAGTLTRWGLPLSRFVMEAGGTLTVGVLLGAAVLLPSTRGVLDPQAVRYLRGASWIAAVWAAGAAATLIFTVSDILGLPAGKIVGGSELSSYVGQIPQGTALMFVVLLAALIALLARTAVTPGSAAGLLVVALVALLPPPLTGHSSSSPNHELAISGLAMHIVALSPWVGGLLALVWHATHDGDHLGVAAGRFSRMALWCYVAVGVSGVANVLSRLPDPSLLYTTDYGRLVLVKLALFIVLGIFGYLHRERTLPALMAHNPKGYARPAVTRPPWAFVRLAGAEVLLMAATLGVAVALARTAPPAVNLDEDAVTSMIGFPMPPPITVARLATMWRPDLFFAALVVVLGGLYAAGVVRLRARGDAWPPGRTIAWGVGLLTIVAVTMTGIATYSPVLFSTHMIQHMVLSMLSPILLVLGAPVTLALRALKPAAIRGDRGPREWLTVILHSRALRFIGHPATATVIFVGSTYAVYFTPLFGYLMRAHVGHLAMLVHFLASGSLFFWVLIGVDPTPRKLPYVAKMLLLFVTMPFHAFFGIALMNLGKPLAAGWYTSLHRPWGTSVLADQHTGGSIAWAFGEIPTFIVLIAMVLQWYADDQRLARRLERQADRTAGKTDDELAEYNAYLASLDKRPPSASSSPPQE